ncbi:MAG: Sec-independent protein translocase protein TatB [Sphingomonas phyllosphaerae]|uniref:Sec-independent protein translocase protein TatB n=1 Tax=Sphingomonas phyllosphaerae TaxID=257003 RepID=UPI002FF9D8D1
MFDIAPSEFLLVAFVALVVIGPKDLPKAMRVLGYWVGRARAVGRQFRNGFDEMVREAELEEMEKKWKAENERIMREHPFVPTPPAAPALPDHASASDAPSPIDDVQHPVMVEKPHVVPEPAAVADEPRNEQPTEVRDGDDRHAPDGRVIQDKAAS